MRAAGLALAVLALSTGVALAQPHEIPPPIVVGPRHDSPPTGDAAVDAFNLCASASNFGYWAEAVDRCSKAIELNPNRLDAYYFRAVAFGVVGQIDRQIADWDYLAHARPDDLMVRSNRGLAYFTKGDYDRAIADFTYVLDNGRDHQALADRALAYLRKGDYEHALADCDAGLAAYPSNKSRLLLIRAQTHYLRREDKLAIQDANAVLDLSSRMAGALYVKGLAEIRTRDDEHGLIDVRRATEMLPNVAEQFGANGVRP